MSKKDLITIDTSAILEVTEDGDKFLFDPSAEDALLKWVNFLKQVEEASELVKEKLGAQMESLNTLKIEGEAVKVSRRYFGERYEIFDREIAQELGYAKVVESVKPDAKEIDLYVKETGELPEGIKLRDRKMSVVISEVKEK